MNITDGYILGVILSKIGLTLEDAYKIMNGQINLNKSEKDIRDFLLENSEIKTPILRKLWNYGINFTEISHLTSVSIRELQDNIDNIFYWFNTLDFAIKINSPLRREIGKLLNSRGYSLKIIGELLDVSPTTIHSDSKFWITHL